MIRVPNYPSKPIKPMVTVGDYVEAGIAVRSFCSSGLGHSHIVDLHRLATVRGPDTVIDFTCKRSLICPECGAAGGGLIIELNGQTAVSGQPKRNLPT